MSRLEPVAFDLETTGLDPDARVTVAGFASSAGTWQALNTEGRPADEDRLRDRLKTETSVAVQIDVHPDEAGLLAAVGAVADDRLDGGRHHLCAFNGETWRGGFDLPFLRTACARHGVDWPFPHLAYADVRSAVKRFNTGDAGDLVGVYERLIGRTHSDPFEDSEEAVAAHEHGEWLSLLRHNLADVVRTYELAVLAGRYVPKSDFDMKNLGPPSVSPRR